MFAGLAALAGVASFVAALACLVVVVTGAGRGVPAAWQLPPAAPADRTSAVVAGDDAETEAVAAVLSAEIAQRQEVLRKRQAAITSELNAGWTQEIAEGRAAMLLAGLDPDDPQAVMGFNARFGLM